MDRIHCLHNSSPWNQPRPSWPDHTEAKDSYIYPNAALAHSSYGEMRGEPSSPLLPWRFGGCCSRRQSTAATAGRLSKETGDRVGV